MNNTLRGSVTEPYLISFSAFNFLYPPKLCINFYCIVTVFSLHFLLGNHKGRQFLLVCVKIFYYYYLICLFLSFTGILQHKNLTPYLVTLNKGALFGEIIFTTNGSGVKTKTTHWIRIRSLVKNNKTFQIAVGSLPPVRLGWNRCDIVTVCCDTDLVPQTQLLLFSHFT